MTALAGILAAFYFGLDRMTVLTTVTTTILGQQIGYVCGSFGASIREQPGTALKAAAGQSDYRAAGNVK